MKKLDDNSIDLIVTSPPYNIGVHYNSYGDKKSDGEYEVFFVKCFLECFRVLKPGGLCCIIVGEQRRHLLLTKARNWLLSIGFDYVKKIDWLKNKHLGFSTTEYIIVCSKGGSYLNYYSKGDKFYGAKNQFADKWFIPYDKTEKKNIHPAAFPVALPQKLIEINTKEGDLVLDPFMGIGSSAVAAKRLNRQYIGFEIDNKYWQIVKDRLESTYLIDFSKAKEPSIVNVKPIFEKPQLNSALKGLIAVYRLKSEKYKAKERQRRSPEPLPDDAERGKAVEQTAKSIGISDRTLKKTLKIIRYIEKYDDEEIKVLWNKSLEGVVSLESVYKAIQMTRFNFIFTSFVDLIIRYFWRWIQRKWIKKKG